MKREEESINVRAKKTKPSKRREEENISVRVRKTKPSEKRREKKAEKKKRKSFNKEVMGVSIIFFCIFMSLGVYLAIFNTFIAEDVINNPYNKRQEKFKERVVRGSIYAADGSLLANTIVDENGNESRNYPYGRVFAHVVGYDSYGKLGIEQSYNYNLLTSHENLFEKLANEFTETKSIGDNVFTTLDVELQNTAYNAIGDKEGAVIALDPATGKILAMVSKPDFDPNTIESNWDNITQADANTGEESGILVNRVTQGKFTPGSVFKLFTLAEFIKENPDYNNYSYNCTGSIGEGKESSKCFDGNVHGTESLMESFANSCNCSFANMGLSLDLNKFAENNEKLLFNKDIDVNFPVSQSSFSLNSESSSFEIMQTSFGQGKTVMTPFHLAVVMSALANNGQYMVPYMVDHTENYEGKMVKEYSPSKGEKLFTESEAGILNEYLRAVVTDGTARDLNSTLYTAYGKTGTAETLTDRGDNMWFAGFATNGSKSLVVVSVVADVKDGYHYSNDITRALFDNYFSR